MTHSARLAIGYHGTWEVYVVTDSRSPEDWPGHDFGRSSPVPTLGERTAALAVLGYEVVEEAQWEWNEFAAEEAQWEWYEFPTGDDTGPVYFLGSLDVRRIPSGEDR